MILVFSSFRCLPEDPEIWDIPWKLCSSGVRGLRGNSEPSQDGVERSSTSQREGGPSSPGPGCWHLQTTQQPSPRSPPGLTPTHSSQAFLSQSFYFLPSPVPQIQRSALKWRLFPGLIETRPPEFPHPHPAQGLAPSFTPMGFL